MASEVRCLVAVVGAHFRISRNTLYRKIKRYGIPLTMMVCPD
jgi:transcriptional regulator of acetoin/glycerol metabolism